MRRSARRVVPPRSARLASTRRWWRPSRVAEMSRMSAGTKDLGIVVAVDGSPASDAATCWAARAAVMRNIPLTVVNVVTTPTATYPPVPYPESLGIWLEDRGHKAAAHAVKIAEDAMPADRKVA